jgi:hypothetical protein
MSISHSGGSSLQLHTPATLKLHAFGLQRLHDPNWTGLDLYDRIKQHVRGRIEPTNLLRSVIPEGLLYHLGLWLFEDYFESDDLLHVADQEYQAWFLEDLVEMLAKAGVPRSAPPVRRLAAFLQKFDEAYERGEEVYYRELTQHAYLFKWWFEIIGKKYASVLADLRRLYATDYADRVFHDRQLCGYLAQLVVRIGFDGQDIDDDAPKQWVRRERIPEWAKKALYARERGCCARCSTPLVLELRNDSSVDHIVPLAAGGCNDLVNLQLLCETCNLQKGRRTQEALSSVPPYIRRLFPRKRG